jgi:hypothetical protein
VSWKETRDALSADSEQVCVYVDVSRVALPGRCHCREGREVQALGRTRQALSFDDCSQYDFNS